MAETQEFFFDCSVLWFTVAFREVVLRFIYACRHTKRIAVVSVPKCCMTSAAKVRFDVQQTTKHGLYARGGRK